MPPPGTARMVAQWVSRGDLDSQRRKVAMLLPCGKQRTFSETSPKLVPSTSEKKPFGAHPRIKLPWGANRFG